MNLDSILRHAGTLLVNAALAALPALVALVVLSGCEREPKAVPPPVQVASTEESGGDACCPPAGDVHDDHAGHDHGSGDAEPADAHAGHDHGDEASADAHAGHDHGDGGSADLDATPAELLARRCEHAIPTYTCNECRYEVGVAKAAPELFAPGSLFGIATAQQRTRGTGPTLNGEVRLDESSSTWITPRVAGIVRRIAVDLGSRVQRGQLLFEVESAEFTAARAEYLRAGAALVAAEAAYARESELFAKRVCPRKDLIEAQAARDEAMAAARAAEEILRQYGLGSAALASLPGQSATAPVAWMPVVAPFDGTILDRSIQLGALVEPGDRLLLVGDLSRVWIVASVHQDDLAGLLEAGEGRAAAVEVQAFPGRTFEGVVERIGGVVSEATRTTAVRVVVDNAGGRLRPGMFAQVRLAEPDPRDAVAVPAEGVLEDEGRSFVFVPVDGQESYFMRRPVVAGHTREGWTEIVEGLHPGQAVVARGAFLLKSDVLRSKMGAGCAD